MTIYDRNYTSLTEEEKFNWDAIKDQEKIYIDNKESPFHKNLYRKYPKAVRHYLSLFPNNLLDIVDLENIKLLTELNDKFKQKIDNPDTLERDILRFIKDNSAYFIIASLLKDNYHFGHHGTYIFPEFKLGTSYQVDYLLVGSGSGGYEFIFTELEKINGSVIKKDGELGDGFRKGIEQVGKWDEWLESNFTHISEIFLNIKSPQQELPKEFYNLDKTRIHYVVISGRRENFTERTYRLRRKYLSENNLRLLHYDNLYDFSRGIISAATY